MIVFNLSQERTQRIFFSFSYWALAFTGIIVGYGLKEMTRWSWNAFLINSIFITYTNGLIAVRYSESTSPLLSFVVSIGLLFLLMYQLGKEIKVPYFLPRIRWWEMNPRYKLVVPVKIERIGSEFEAEILDISFGGCFIKTRTDMAQNERISTHFSLFGESLVIQGTVVWRSQSSVTHPKGVGVKFDVLENDQKKIMKAATAHLRKITAVQNSRNKLSVAEFNERISKLKSHQLGITQSTQSSKDQAS